MAKSDAERFGHRCPYTDKQCDTFDCEHCEIEERERRWSEELQGESRIIAEADVLEQIKADAKALIKEKRGESQYDMGYIYAVYSVLDIIDKHTKGNAPHTSQN